MSESNKLTFEQFLAIWQMHNPTINDDTYTCIIVRDGRTDQCPLESISGIPKNSIWGVLALGEQAPTLTLTDAETIFLAADYPSSRADERGYSLPDDISAVRLALMGR